MTKPNKPSKAATLEQWAGATASKSKHFTVLFTDIIGSTALNAKMGDKRWINLLITHFERARYLALQYDCYEIKIIGDSFMVAFKNVNEALKFATDFLNSTGDKKIKIRAAINCGDVRILEDDIYGGMVTYASRMLQCNNDEGIYLSNWAKEQIESEEGLHTTQHFFIRTTHKLKGYDEKKIMWSVNLDEYWKKRICQDFPLAPSLKALSKDQGEMNYIIQPATAKDIKWFSYIEADAYGRDAIPLNILKKWYERNPTGFFIIKSKEGKKVGHLDILPLCPEILNSFKEGNIAECKIGSDAIYMPSEKAQIIDLYVESLIILSEEETSKTSVVYTLLSDIKSLFGQVCNIAKLQNVYAMAATQAGERFMKQLGFKTVKDGSERKDGHPFFGARYDDILVNINTILGLQVGSSQFNKMPRKPRWNKTTIEKGC